MVVRTVMCDRALNSAVAAGGPARAQFLHDASVLRPDLAEPWRLRADEESFGDPGTARTLAERAVGLNPHDWRNWQTLALIDYQLGRTAAAQHDFDQSVRVANGADAHFALASFAFLQGHTAAYWHELGAALALAQPVQAYAILQQAYAHASADERTRLGAMVPAKTEVIAMAAQFFLNHGELEQAAAQWDRLDCAPNQRESCGQLTLNLVNQLMKVAYTAPTPSVSAALAGRALEIWNHAVASQLVQGSAAAWDRSSDPAFAGPWNGPTFEWRTTGLVSARPSDEEGASGLRMDFSGFEPEDAVLLSQWMAIRGGQRYRLSITSRRLGPGSETGLVAVVAFGNGEPPKTLAASLSDTPTTETVSFPVPAGHSVVDLSLAYARPSGEVRLSGSVLVSRLSLSAEQP